MPKHSWRKTILLLSKLTLPLSGILELAGPDCLFENTLHDTFFDFVDWVSQKQSTVIEAKKKKNGVQPLVETTKQGVLELSSKAPMDKFDTDMCSRYAIFRKTIQ